MKRKQSPQQPYLPRLLHGRTNMESGVISLKERGWSISGIAITFKISEETVERILAKFGWGESGAN